MKRLAIAVLIACVCAALTGCGTAVPDLKGKTVVQAAEVLVVANFKVGTITYDEKAVEATGSIVTQTPVAGAMAQAGSTVALTVAGAAPVTTPSLLGLDRAGAEAALAAAGLTLGDVIESYDASAAAGVVASQTPSPGLDSFKDSTVAVVISKGPEPVAVPKVVGKSAASATALLEAVGFKVKTAEKDGPAKKGAVSSQSPAGGKMVAPGKTVTLTVGTGWVKVPDFWKAIKAHHFKNHYASAAFDPYTPAMEAESERFDAEFKAVVSGAASKVGLRARVEWQPIMQPDKQVPRVGARTKVGTMVVFYVGIGD